MIMIRLQHSLRTLILLLILLAAGSLTLNASAAPPHPIIRHPFENTMGVYVWRDGGQIKGGEALKKTGAQWASIFIVWSEIEKQPGVYDWEQTDRILGDVSAHGFDTVVTVIGNPAWAADTICGPIHEDQLPRFGNFLTALVQRYSAAPYNITYWALYNEPDNANASPYFVNWLGGCWGGNHPNALPDAGGAAYAHMLSYAYPAIKAGNPNARVALGGLAYDYFAGIDEGGVFDPAFLDDMLAAGGGQYFDVINYHYYKGFDWRWEDEKDGVVNPYSSWIQFKGHYLQSEVERYTGEIKPVLCTEVGDGSREASGADRSEFQARFLVKTLVRAYYGGIYPIIWFDGVDETWLPGGDSMTSMGLMDDDLNPKTSYVTYQTLVRELSGARFVRTRKDLGLRFEGYEFEKQGRRKLVLWDSESGIHSIVLHIARPGGALRMVEKTGESLVITDGSGLDKDGLRNGAIEVIVSKSPRYYEDLSLPLLDEQVFLPILH